MTLSEASTLTLLSYSLALFIAYPLVRTRPRLMLALLFVAPWTASLIAYTPIDTDCVELLLLSANDTEYITPNVAILPDGTECLYEAPHECAPYFRNMKRCDEPAVRRRLDAEEMNQFIVKFKLSQLQKIKRIIQQDEFLGTLPSCILSNGSPIQLGTVKKRCVCDEHDWPFGFRIFRPRRPGCGSAIVCHVGQELVGQEPRNVMYRWAQIRGLNVITCDENLAMSNGVCLEDKNFATGSTHPPDKSICDQYGIVNEELRDLHGLSSTI